MSGKSGNSSSNLLMLLVVVALALISILLMAVPLLICGLILYYYLKLSGFRKQVLSEPEIDLSLFSLTEKEIEQINSLKLNLEKSNTLRRSVYAEIDKYESAGRKLNLTINNDGTFSRRSKNGKIIQDNLDVLNSQFNQVQSNISHLKNRIRNLENAPHNRLQKVAREWDEKIATLGHLYEQFYGFSAALVGWLLAILVFTQFITIVPLQAIADQYHFLIAFFSSDSEELSLFDTSTWVFALAFAVACGFYYAAKIHVKNIDTVKKFNLSAKNPIKES